MKIIISPAKQITDKHDFNYLDTNNIFSDKTNKLYDYLRSLDYDELKLLINTSDKLCKEVYDNLHKYRLDNNYIHALFAYDGIQYKYMQASILDTKALDYLNDHLYIVSGLYGLLKPFDRIIPYRLEMQSKINYEHYDSLYKYWNNTLYDEIFKDTDTLINLASNEYAKAIVPYKTNKHKIINIYFYEDTDKGLKEKGVYVKMARGKMVQYLAIKQITNIEDIKSFNELNYNFNEELSNDSNYIFVRKEIKC